jgi:hypothetical protein
MKLHSLYVHKERRGFTCKRGIMWLSTYRHKVYRLFVDYLGLLRRLSTRPVTNRPRLLPQSSMVYSFTFLSTLVILTPYPRVGQFTDLKLRVEIIWLNLIQITGYSKVPPVIFSLSRFSFRKLFKVIFSFANVNENYIRDLCIHGRMTLRYMLEIVWDVANWIHLAQDRGQWWFVVIMAMSLHVP